MEHLKAIIFSERICWIAIIKRFEVPVRINERSYNNKTSRKLLLGFAFNTIFFITRIIYSESPTSLNLE